jgi:hypothetical protein
MSRRSWGLVYRIGYCNAIGYLHQQVGSTLVYIGNESSNEARLTRLKGEPQADQEACTRWITDADVNETSGSGPKDDMGGVIR